MTKHKFGYLTVLVLNVNLNFRAKEFWDDRILGPYLNEQTHFFGENGETLVPKHTGFE